MQAQGSTNIEAHVANVYSLPHENAYFDLAYMIAVSGEIPDLEKAICEIHRVIKTGGKLVFSELFLDPDYPLSSTLIRKTTPLGFHLIEKIGNFFYYTLIFEKP
jgi:ubiquinone/menaquinone biosynthesis C-methylase UbiE